MFIFISIAIIIIVYIVYIDTVIIYNNYVIALSIRRFDVTFILFYFFNFIYFFILFFIVVLMYMYYSFMIHLYSIKINFKNYKIPKLTGFVRVWASSSVRESDICPVAALLDYMTVRGRPRVHCLFF